MKYRTIVADPPWDHEGGASTPGNPKLGAMRAIVARPLPYPSMTLEEIAALPVSRLAMDDCRLFLWTTNRYLPASFDILGKWGFRYRQLLVWRKLAFGRFGGSVTPNAAEYLLVASRGQPELIGRWSAGSVVDGPGNIGGAVNGNRPNKHSRKPEVFLDLVEQVSPGPYVELFARRARFGWDHWGDESLETARLAFDEDDRSRTGLT